MAKKIKVREPIGARSEMVKQMLIGTKGGAHRDRRDRRKANPKHREWDSEG